MGECNCKAVLNNIETIIYYIILAVVPRRSFDVYILRLFTHFRASHKTCTRTYNYTLENSRPMNSQCNVRELDLQPKGLLVQSINII